MRYSWTLKRFLIIVASWVLLLTPRTSHAGNANSFFLGNNASLTAGTVAAWTRDSEALWYNPAGMGGNQMTRLSLSGQAFQLRLQKIPGGMETILPSGTRTDDVSGNEYAAVPTTLSYVHRATGAVSWGFGVFVPKYQDTSLDHTLNSTESFPGLAGQMSYGQGFDIDVLDQEYHLGAGVGWEAWPGLRLGAALFVLYDRVRYNRSLFESIASADGSGSASLYLVDDSRALVSGVGTRATVGAQWQFAPSWQLGIVLFSPTLQITSWGKVSHVGAGTYLNPQGGIGQAAGRDSKDIQEWDWEMVEPFHTQLALAWVRPSFLIGTTVDFFLPLERADLLIDKRFTWNVAVGSKFKVTDKIDMGAGFFTDRSDEPDPASLGEGRINYYGVTTGAEFRTPISRGQGEEPFTFATVTALRYALGIGDVGGGVFDPARDGNIGTMRIRSVSARFHEISVYLGTSLYF